MICRLRNLLLFSAASVAAASSAEHYYDGDTTAPPRAHQLDDTYTFEQYLSHFDKTYDDIEEYERRSHIFAKNLDKILSHNEGKKFTDDGRLVSEGYAMGVNMFTDVVGSSELPMGYNKALHPVWRSQLVGAAVSKTERLLGAADTEAYSKPPAFDMDEVASLPIEVDWTSEGKVSPAPSQGGCGSCWSFAATATIESHLAIATGEDPVPLSEQNMLQCTPNPDDCGGDGQCSGSTVELALNYVADITTKKTGGMFKVEDVPYSAQQGSWEKCEDVTKGKSPSVGIEGWTQLNSNDYKATMNAIAKVGPLAIAVAAGGWGAYEQGIFDTEETEVNHAVLLVGYGVDEDTGDKFWKVRNSWGTGFGEDGYIKIKRSDDDDKVCGMDNNPLVGLACALDDNGNKIDVKPAKVCGTGAILFDVSFPVGAHLITE